ncbi:DUF7352 domain-containing protein [Marinobacter mangrovi]|uniref:DUF7352 domain-containing protein n=1 Tax=Marinobacter mangrovi TaxID=2803918 RepID=UPI0019321CDC|nr:hypothetical protein [Marinobacter mangrovi]
MKVIHKYALEMSGESKLLTLNKGYRMVRCEYVVPQKQVFLWVEEPLSAEAAQCERWMRVVASGQPVPDSYRYVDTALDPFGPEAYHVYELPMHEGDSANPTDWRSAWTPRAVDRVLAS